MEAEDGSEKGRAKETRRTEVWKGGEQARRIRDASKEEGNPEEWTQRQEGYEQKTGNRDRIV